MSNENLGRLIYSFFTDYLVAQKGLRSSSIKTYRDVIRLFLQFTSTDTGRKITRLSLEDLSAGQVKSFLNHLEGDRKNHTRTRNQSSSHSAHLFTIWCKSDEKAQGASKEDHKAEPNSESECAH